MPPKTWEQLGNNSARTSGKRRGEGRPERKASQQDKQPGPACKTSIPGSNPGGASNLFNNLQKQVADEWRPVTINVTTTVATAFRLLAHASALHLGVMLSWAPNKARVFAAPPPLRVLHRFTKRGHTLEISGRKVTQFAALEFIVFFDGQLQESQMSYNDARRTIQPRSQHASPSMLTAGGGKKRFDILYQQLAKQYSAYLASDMGRDLVTRFCLAYPSAQITEVKMLDFVLWQSRTTA